MRSRRRAHRGGDRRVEALRISTVATIAATVSAPMTAWTVAHRASPVVRAWAPPTFAPAHVGDLAVRMFGAGDTTLLLLHGLGASGGYWGNLYEPLADQQLMIVPDLLGFGRSLDEQRSDFSRAAHLSALDTVLNHTATGPDSQRRRLVIGAHSMGSALALALASRHRDLVDRVVLFGPPMYRNPGGLRNDAGNHSAMTRLLLTDSPWARRLCRLNCSHRELSGWLMAASTPRLPVPIGRDASKHTWGAYEQGLDEFVLASDWECLLDVDVNVHLVRGTNDTIGDGDFITELASASGDVELHLVAGADHHVALSHAEMGRELLGVQE